MQLLPDWAPNIHPMIVHFPIVLLMVAIFFDTIHLFIKKYDWLEKSALALYLLGTIAIVITYFTGRAAADGLDIPARVIPAVTDHADWAEITFWFFIAFSVVRLTIGIWFKSLKKIIVIPIVLIGLLGIYFLYQTADYGAKLVFGYGLGTGNILKSEQVGTEKVNETIVSDSSFTVRENGSWKLIADDGVMKVLSEKFNWVEGSINELNPMYNESEGALMFHLGKDVKQGGFVYNDDVKDVQVSAQINIDELSGELELIHHFIDNNNYDFLGIGNGKISLSRKNNGKLKVFEEDKYNANNWIEIKVISDKTHFRGYVNNKLIVHGHGDEPKPGSIGLKLSGSGAVSIKVVDVESLEK